MYAHEEPEVLRLMRLLWPDCEDETITDEAVLVLERESGSLGEVDVEVRIPLRLNHEVRSQLEAAMAVQRDSARQKTLNGCWST